uniref:Putative voltage-gated potassium channel n=1 Tax=Schistosoma mansoni TaxID=6183 RepID=A0A5K4ESM4_SCHMA
MAGSRRGLVAPQNIFLETVLRRFSTPQTGLLIANARIVDHPIIYVNESFTKMTNYTSREMMHQNAICRQLHGKRTSINSIERLKNALDEGYFDQVEITLYKKNQQIYRTDICRNLRSMSFNVINVLELIKKCEFMKRMEKDCSTSSSHGSYEHWSKFKLAV